MSGLIFLLSFQTKKGERLAGNVIESLRTFGGVLSDSPVWVLVIGANRTAKVLPGYEGIERFPVIFDTDFPSYPFAEKVYACAKAETMVGPHISSLVWLSLDCLIINPPLLFNLGKFSDFPPADAAFRPVHHRNIGSLASDPLDFFWGGIYKTLKVDQMPHTIKSFADEQILRPYFNCHCFAFNPALGLGQSWWQSFQTMVTDENFQSTACGDDLHKIFLHQAILSTLVSKLLSWGSVRLLPPEYNFPLNLLDELSKDNKPKKLNTLVNAVYEDAFPWGKIEIEEPLHSWLKQHL